MPVRPVRIGEIHATYIITCAAGLIRSASMNNIPSIHSEHHVERMGAGSRDWKTSLRGKYALKEYESSNVDKQR